MAKRRNSDVNDLDTVEALDAMDAWDFSVDFNVTDGDIAIVASSRAASDDSAAYAV